MTTDTKELRDELSGKVDNLYQAMSQLMEFVDEKDIGGDTVFCDGYPFDKSFDELIAEVVAWNWKIQGVSND